MSDFRPATLETKTQREDKLIHAQIVTNLHIHRIVVVIHDVPNDISYSDEEPFLNNRIE